MRWLCPTTQNTARLSCRLRERSRTRWRWKNGCNVCSRSMQEIWNSNQRKPGKIHPKSSNQRLAKRIMEDVSHFPDEERTHTAIPRLARNVASKLRLRRRSWKSTVLVNVHMMCWIIVDHPSWYREHSVFSARHSSMRWFRVNKEKENKQQQDWKQKGQLTQSPSYRPCCPKKRSFYPKKKHWHV